MAGDLVQVAVRNDLPESTSVHWHGLALRNDMDGVPGATQDPIAAGSDYTYEFIADQPGTYWFHPHVGPQLDRGLYGALIVEDPHEPLSYDDEWVVILDDWLDGVTGTPDEVSSRSAAAWAGMRPVQAGPHADGRGLRPARWATPATSTYPHCPDQWASRQQIRKRSPAPRGNGFACASSTPAATRPSVSHSAATASPSPTATATR